MAIKVGCTAWFFTEPAHNPPYEDAIRSIGELGFDCMELILRDFKDIEGYWTPQKVREIRAMLDDYNLEVSQFAMFQNIMGGLADLNLENKRRSIETFEIGCDIAARLNCKIVNFVSPWPAGFEAPVQYLPDYLYINSPGAIARPGEKYVKFHTKFKMWLPKDFDWTACWENHLDAVRQVTEIAKQFGQKLAIETHTHVMTGHTDAALRMMDHIPEENLGVNMDIGFAYAQREFIPWSIYKLGKKLFNVHARDGDGLAQYRLPVGAGTLDWEGIICALKDIQYDGAISIEWAHDADACRHAKESQAYLRELIRTVEPSGRRA